MTEGTHGFPDFLFPSRSVSDPPALAAGSAGASELEAGELRLEASSAMVYRFTLSASAVSSSVEYAPFGTAAPTHWMK
jgi:hypothetical protein